MPDQLHLEQNPDIEQIPTPKIPEEREVVSRIKINAKSLKLLCRDMASFVHRAESSSPLSETVEEDYFTRMYHLLLRLNLDFSGHEHNAAHLRAPLSLQEIDETLSEDLRESFRLIEESLQPIRPIERKILNPELRSLLEEIEDITRVIKKELTSKPKKRLIEAETHP